MRICVVYGGISTERDISIMTGKNVVEKIDRSKYEIVELIINEKKDIFKLVDMDIDFCFIALHGKFGEDGICQAILESLDIPYYGANTLSSAICMDKDFTKMVAKRAKVKTAKWWVVERSDSFKYKKKYGRLIVKPNSGGSSIGVSFVENQEQLDKALELVFSMDRYAIIEKVVKGIEISVPIINGNVYPTVRIEALMGEYFDYTSKYADGGAKEYVYKFDKKIQRKINEYTIKMYNALKINSFARIDYIVDENDVYMIEVNTLPGMTGASILPKSLNYLGYSYPEVLDLLIESSIEGKK